MTNGVCKGDSKALNSTASQTRKGRADLEQHSSRSSSVVSAASCKHTSPISNGGGRNRPRGGPRCREDEGILSMEEEEDDGCRKGAATQNGGDSDDASVRNGKLVGGKSKRNGKLPAAEPSVNGVKALKNGDIDHPSSHSSSATSSTERQKKGKRTRPHFWPDLR